MLRLGRAGEGYDGIRKDRVNVEGRLTLVDARGPFGNPTSDSARTMTTPDTRDVLVVLYVPAVMPRPLAERALALTRERLAAYAGGDEELA
jgi:DNA/RNA-binding domain of Phe-tRNA-synthetase-like protein